LSSGSTRWDSLGLVGRMSYKALSFQLDLAWPSAAILRSERRGKGQTTLTLHGRVHVRSRQPETQASLLRVVRSYEGTPWLASLLIAASNSIDAETSQHSQARLAGTTGRGSTV
jgi:hypothetical protein